MKGIFIFYLINYTVCVISLTVVIFNTMYKHFIEHRDHNLE